ncbi:hypothetical protein R6Q57_021420 [Mikania cordata]
MPPQFYDILCGTPNHGALPFSIGMKEEYLALWDVDKVDMQKLEMYVYFTRNCDVAACQTTSIHWLVYPIIIRFQTFFKSFLDNILFRKNSRRNVIPKFKISGTKVWPQYNGPNGSNSGDFSVY